MNANEQHDCIVIGGGPAGATAATLLAEWGHEVLLLEKATFPRYHIGESLMPQTFWIFKRLGVLNTLRASAYPRKQSVQFVNASGKESLPYYFTDRDPNEWSTTWQVWRDEFDRMMLDNARARGAVVREGVSVSKVLFEGSRAVGVVARRDGRDSEIAARIVIDATGSAAVLSNQLGIRSPDPKLKKASVYSYYEGAYRDEGRNAGATIIIHTPDRSGWFWFIPLPDDLTSVGIVAAPSYLCSGRGNDPAATLDEEIARAPAAAKRLEHARRVRDVFVTRDFSYRADRVAGDGWVLIGDAFGFLDPIYSSGVMFALKSGEMAADAIHEALEAGDLSAARLGRWGPTLNNGMQLIRRLVYAFYDPEFSFGRFMRAHPEQEDRLVRLLIGDVFNDEVGAIFDAMRDWTDLPELSPLVGGNGAT
ncbi:MAG: tryptophan 7-halogenase [Planctomycetes bacterium]|nr:tryptophan 7-halogenase [Planctomycetota bacterium]